MGFGLDDIVETVVSAAEIPGDLVEAAGSLFDGPGGIVGVFVSGAFLFVGGPAAMFPAVIAGASVSQALNALIRTRRLSDEERTLAEMVFGKSLPYDKIILTNLWHPQGRAFVVPNALGECLVNLGDDFHDPMRAIKGSYIEIGQLLVHELTHTLQIRNASFVPGLICSGIVNQVRNELEDGVYDPGAGGKPWADYNLEQQGALVDMWYGGLVSIAGGRKSRTAVGGCSPAHPYFRYVVEINGGVPPLAVQALSVRTMARRKFGTEGAFAVRSVFKDYAPGPARRRSLRKSLIGMSG